MLPFVEDGSLRPTRYPSRHVPAAARARFVSGVRWKNAANALASNFAKAHPLEKSGELQHLRGSRWRATSISS